MQKWEYLVLNDWPSEIELNDLGYAGWELVAVGTLSKGGYYGDGEKVRLYFKREVD